MEILRVENLNKIYGKGENKVKAVDTTAAGDTFTGFFVSAISKGKSPKEALDLASRASAIAVSRPGAAPSVPTLDEVENWEFAE